MDFRGKRANDYPDRAILKFRSAKTVTIVLLCCLSAVCAYANDGVFYAAGNQLIPITETDISIKKEVLTINRAGDHLEVTVCYEFFNPVGEKELLVGFEAVSPYNSNIDPFAMFPNHPHMRNFKVTMNGEPLSFDIALVENIRYNNKDNSVPQYYVNGHIENWTKQRIEDSLAAWDYPPGLPVDYVYHFKAKFRPGLNIVQHTYEYDLSFTIGEEFYFPYVLTAANRWANRQIDDFTLNINMGDRESFRIKQTFFNSTGDWTINGTGMVTDCHWEGWDTVQNGVIFHIHKGGISFHKQNFHPNGELTVAKDELITTLWNSRNGEQDLSTEEKLINGIKTQYFALDTLFVTGFFEEAPRFSPIQCRILRNLPFAYHGYKFKDKKLQHFFESTKWYIRNPEYKGETEALSEKEKAWVKFWSK